MLTKQKLIYQIKHHPVIRKTYETLGSATFTTMGKFTDLDEHLVLIVGNTGKSFSGSPRAIYEYMRAHEEYDKYRVVQDRMYLSDFDKEVKRLKGEMGIE